MKKRVLAMLLTGLMAFSLAGCSDEAQPSSQESTPASSNESSDTNADSLEGTLTLNGSTSMTSVCDALGEAFMDLHSSVKVEKASTGSGAAVTAVNDGTALIGDLSRKVKDDEDPDNFTAVTIALDGIAVVVNADNAVDGLTSDEIVKIFTGEITNWSEVGGADASIVVIGREESSGTRDGFESIFKVDDECAYAAELAETGDVVSRINSDENAIGYVSLASVSEGIKALDVDGVKATEENVSDGTYVVQRPFVQIYKKGSDNELIKAWFEFLASSEGQEIIKSQKLIPVDIITE